MGKTAFEDRFRQTYEEGKIYHFTVAVGKIYHYTVVRYILYCGTKRVRYTIILLLCSFVTTIYKTNHLQIEEMAKYGSISNLLNNEM